MAGRCGSAPPAIALYLRSDAEVFGKVTWTSAHFDEVADGHERLEGATVDTFVADPTASEPCFPHGPVVVCDTDALATAVWHQRYLGRPAPHLSARAAAKPPLLYVLTTPAGVAFAQDGLRDGQHLREDMTCWFRGALHRQEAPWIEVRGSPPVRVAQVRAWVAAHAGPAVRTASSPRGERSGLKTRTSTRRKVDL